MSTEKAAFEKAIDDAPHDASNHLVYADWLDEHGEPDEAAFRRSMGNWLQNGAQMLHRKYPDGIRPSVSPWVKMPWKVFSNNLPEGVKADDIETWGNKPVRTHWVFRTDGTGYFPRDPADAAFDWTDYPNKESARSWEKYRHMEEGLRRAFMKGRKVKLARINIIPSGPRAGDEPGINMWTGKPANPDRKPPIRAVHIPENHPADGIIHDHTVAEAAHHERSAVHSALERLAPGVPFSQKDVADHVAAIRLMLGHEQGKAFLGGPGERYVSAAKTLPTLLPYGGKGTLLRGTSEGARAVGPRVDHLTGLAVPLVAAANKLLARAGRATSLADRLAKPESTKPAYEVVSEKDIEIPDGIGAKKKRQLPPIKVPGSETEAVKTLASESLRADPGGKDNSAPIALAESPPPLGGKWPTQSRFDTLADLGAKAGDRSAALRHLMDTHLLTRRQAADTYRRWLRAEAAKRSGPVQLARPKDDQPIGPQHLYGEAYSVQPEGFGTGPDVTREGIAKPKRFTVDPRLAGTSLAYHLRRIAQEHAKEGNVTVASLAEHALAGKPVHGINNADPFKMLGRTLHSMGHKDSKLFKWDHVNEQLHIDNWLEKTLSKMVQRKEGENDSTFFDRIHRRVKGGPKEKDTWAFWNKLLELRKSTPGFPHNRKLSMQDWLDAIHRVSDKALDRDYIAAVKADKGKGASHKAADPLYWRGVVAKPEAHAKFSRQ